jgi:hypothetical protein
MKTIGIIIAACAALVAGQAMAAAKPAAPPPIDKKQRDQGMKEAPAAVAAAKLTCTLKDAYFVNQATDTKTKAKINYYEVACNEGLGYLLESQPTSTRSFDCIAVNYQADESAAKGDNSGLRCRLPDNANPAAGLAPILAAGGKTCTPAKVKPMGSTASGQSYYEVQCGPGDGAVLETAPGVKPKVLDCIQFLGGPSECSLTAKAEIQTRLAATAAKSGKACTMSDFRYVASDTATGDNYYEIACGSSPGYMLQASAGGDYKNAIDCTRAQSIAGGCTLTDTSAAAAEDLAQYKKLTAANGYPCDVAKYRFLGVDKASNSEVVELSCNDHADGAVAKFPIDKGGKAVIMDCLQAGGLGLSCTLSQPSALYAKYTSAIASKKATSTCKVSGAKWLAQTATTDLIETACSDGLPGWVVSVNKTGGFGDLLTCGEVTRAGAACQLPTNTKK